jgi:antitoxin ParD1/3/4
MQHVEKMSIALTTEMAAAVREAVRSGEYASASEVVRDALRIWKAHQAARAREVDELRQAWRDGIDSGPATPLDVGEIKAKARAAFAQEHRKRRA